MSAADGDLKENSAFIFWTEKARFIYSQIEETMLALRKVVIQKKPEHTDFVCFGHQVKVLYENSQDEKEFILVGPSETQFFPNGVSCETPMAQSLMGKKAGETVSVNNQPVKILEIKITEI